MLENVDLQHVALRRAADKHWPGREMRPRPRRHLFERAQMQRVRPRLIGMEVHLVPGHPGRESHGVARVDFEDRRNGGVEITPDHVLGRGGNLVVAAHGVGSLEVAPSGGSAAAIETIVGPGQMQQQRGLGARLRGSPHAGPTRIAAARRGWLYLPARGRRKFGGTALYRVSHNQKHLADEFMANPFGRASPELQRVLMVFRGEPLEGKPVLICTKPFEEWALAIHSGKRGVPPQLTEHRFASLEEAERFVFRLRWKKYTGHDLA